jgi:hypothetical protein
MRKGISIVLMVVVLVVSWFRLFGQEQPQIKNLPFGCKILDAHKFPVGWIDMNSDLPDEYNLKSDEKVFNNINKYFNNLNDNIKKKYLLPQINSIEIINVSDKSWRFDSTLVYKKDSFQYRLPDFGIYECYYSYNFINEIGFYKENKYGKYCYEAGNLVLYNKKSKTAKLLNIYIKLSNGEGTWWSNRYFYIKKNKEIIISEGDLVEGLFTLENKYIITIQDNGEIKIEESKMKDI